jgi:hypothetical protein
MSFQRKEVKVLKALFMEDIVASYVVNLCSLLYIDGQTLKSKLKSLNEKIPETKYVF